MFNIAGNNASGYNINNSLRFRASASAFLSRTPATASNRKTWTWSGWVKRGTLSSSTAFGLFGSGSSGSNQSTAFYFTNDLIQFQHYIGGGVQNWSYATSAVFRDPSAWYHIVLVVDTTQASSANGVKLYVNGIQQTFPYTFGGAGGYSQNQDLLVNATNQHQIGQYFSGSYLDGYLAEVNFVDGQALTPSSFGSTDAVTGSWIPKKYSGTYGTNGFYLPFTDNSALTTSSNVGLGKDFSGNTNYWVTNNISITAGTTYDSMKDVPTNTSITTGNYAVINPLWKGSAVTITNGNLSYSATGATNSIAYSTYGITSGKWYAEWTQGTTPAGGAMYVGISLDSINPNHSWLGQNAGEYSYLNSNGFKANNNTQTSYGATWGLNDVIGVAFDADARTITFYKNGASQGVAYSSIPAGTYYFANGNNPASTVTGHWNFGQRPFTALPTGFSAVNTFNLPDSTIKKANTVMDATLYTGNGTTQTITNAAGFRPDLVWFKERSSNSSHWLFDTIRGVLNRISSNETAAEANQSGTLTAFNSNGFSVGSDVASNESGQTYVGWQWQASASTVTNTSGTISAQVRASTTAGFSVVTYTGTGANATVGHGLGVAPKMIIVKTRNAIDNWAVYHSSTGATQYLQLNAANASASSITLWNDTSPTSTVFSVGTNNDVNGSTRTYVAYCWAEIAGFSKFGSYTGNGSADGTFVYLGFRPKFVMIKRTDSTGSWYMLDTSRATYNVVNPYLLANASNAEATDLSWDILSNGFKLRSSYIDINTNAATMIYMAFAENPFKNSNAR